MTNEIDFEAMSRKILNYVDEIYSLELSEVEFEDALTWIKNILERVANHYKLKQDVMDWPKEAAEHRKLLAERYFAYPEISVDTLWQMLSEHAYWIKQHMKPVAVRKSEKELNELGRSYSWEANRDIWIAGYRACEKDHGIEGE